MLLSMYRCFWINIFFLIFSFPLLAGEGAFSSYRYCFDDVQKAPCAVQPFDLNPVDGVAFYHVLNAAQQEPFDRFAWRNFIALNWPASGKEIGTARKDLRVWQGYRPLDDVMEPVQKPVCQAPTGGLRVSRFHQTSGRPLIDRNGNYVVYDIHINRVGVQYIQNNSLQHKDGQAAVSKISFPAGEFDPAREGTVLLKSAWMVMAEGMEAENYFTLPGVIEVLREDSISGKAACLEVTLGLVGLHIVQKGTAGMGDHWIWSTFEHVDNAPLSPHPRDPVANMAIGASRGDCSLPRQTDKIYNFYSQNKAGLPSGKAWKWARHQPYARDEQGTPLAPDNIARCWDIFNGTKLTNRIWQQKLDHSVWKNYMLVSSQWRGNLGGEGFGIGELPRFLSNTSMESFIQEEGSCLSCHKDAVDALGRFSDFTFILRDAR